MGCFLMDFCSDSMYGGRGSFGGIYWNIYVSLGCGGRDVKRCAAFLCASIIY